MEVFSDFSTTASGLKGRVQNVANSLQNIRGVFGLSTPKTAFPAIGKISSHLLQLATNELESGKNHVEEMKCGNTAKSTAMQNGMEDLERCIQADLQRLDEDFRAQMNLQKNENVRLQQCLTTLKGEKTSIHQQVIAIQRRVDEIDEEIGNE